MYGGVAGSVTGPFSHVRIAKAMDKPHCPHPNTCTYGGGKLAGGAAPNSPNQEEPNLLIPEHLVPE
ncbi:hypothetical protein E2C01_072862 [Portunus trituberculatus]|uniref:Uncharacterized protein n=1 Tax=Portunus trituberculatus TaxID=210409 RepID=A0A5B7IA29_PORTR|nr:hypothetical protein [Portunus trituberculatus]